MLFSPLSLSTAQVTRGPISGQHANNWQHQIPIYIYLHQFEVLVKHVLLFGCEVWAHEGRYPTQFTPQAHVL